MTPLVGRRPNDRELSDRRLAQLAASGDDAAFAAIYHRYHQGLYRYCKALLGNGEDARDALQGTMLKAARSISSQRKEGALKAWLYRIAHNECISLLRRVRPHERLQEDEAFHEAHALHAPTVAGEAIRRARLRQLMTDLQQLPARQRQALIMRELNGLEFGEIAEVLGTTPDAAKQTTYQARKALRDYEEGRDTRCDSIRESIAARDGRVKRGRRVRAHLQDCAHCRDFDRGVASRAGALAAIAPPLPLALSAPILTEALGSGAGAATAFGAGTLAMAGKGLAAGWLAAAGAAVATGAVAVGIAMGGGVGGGASDGAERAAGASPVAPAAQHERARKSLGGSRETSRQERGAVERRSSAGSPAPETPQSGPPAPPAPQRNASPTPSKKPTLNELEERLELPAVPPAPELSPLPELPKAPALGVGGDLKLPR